MADEFDPYHRWLGIPPEEQPPHHYRLLGIKAFEANPEVIRDAAQQRIAHVRTYQLGKSQALSQRILNELAAAKACLSDPQQKAAYDTRLRQKLAQPTKAPIPEVIKRIGNARLEQFVQHIMQSGLLSGSDISAHYEGLPPEKHPQDSQALARALVKANQLTKYQAELVYQGKIKGLAFGDYRVLDKLGEGGMGMVFKAQHRRMKRLVAVKMILGAAMKSPGAVKRFYREVEAAAQLQHPNIVTAYDASEYEGVHYLVMQFVEGKDLGAVVKERGPLPIDQAVDYIIQAARGLHYAHKQNIIHRDIKPANLLVDKEGTVKILDMGLARMAGLVDEEDRDRLTQSGQVMGTVDYMAPEQALDTHNVDARTDIYSLGCTLYRLLTGEAMYKGESLAKILIAHQMSPVPSLSNARNDVPLQLDAVFQKMVAKKPEDRYPTMAEVIAALETCLSKGTEPASSVREEAGAVLPAAGNLSALKTTTPPSAATATKKKAEPRAQATFSQHAAAADTSKQLGSDEKLQAAPRKKKALTIAVACGLLGVLGVIAFEVIIRIQRPDGTEQIIRAPQGSEVSVREDGSGNVKTTAPPALGNSFNAPPPAVAPFDAPQAKQHQEAWAKYLGAPVKEINSIGMPLVLIPPGEFQMGSTPEESAWAMEEGKKQDEKLYYFDRVPRESPRHRVKITRPIYLGMYQVTQAEYEKVMGVNPSDFTEKQLAPSAFSPPLDAQGIQNRKSHAKQIAHTDTSRYPVEMVNWNEAMEFCRKLSAMPAERAASRVYRLPTEAQWEYACRAGTTTRWYCGDDEKQLVDVAWFGHDAILMTHPVGQKKPNAWGLYDMHGMGQWCLDWADWRYYEQSPPNDPNGPSNGRTRLARGGHWPYHPSECRSAFRSDAPPELRDSVTGFRVACGIETTVAAETAKKKGGPTAAPAEKVAVTAVRPMPAHVELLAEPVVIKPRDALSEMALVAKPAPLDGVLSWTVETIGHRGDVLALEYSPDGRYLASAGYDGTIRLWNVATGKLHRALVGQNSLVAFVSWSPDSRLLAVASSDVMAGTAGGRASIWDVETGLIVRHDVAPQATAIQWSPDGRRIAYAKGKDVEIKDLASQSPQAMHLEGLTAGVEALAWSPDGGLLAAQTNQKNKKDKTFCIWDTHTGRLRQRIDPPKAGNANGRLAWSPDGTMLARGDLVSGEIWDVASAKLLHSFPQQAKSVAWSPDGRTVAFGLSSEPGGIKLHDAKSGNLLWQYVPEGPLGPAVAFSRDGQTVAAAGKSATILLLDAKSGRIRGSLGGHAFSSNGTIAFSPDSRQMVCSQPSDDPGVRFWDVNNGDLLSRWGLKADGAIFAWSQDGKLLAIASVPRAGPKVAGVWEMASQKCLRTVPGCGSFRDNLLLFPDGRTIATIEGDRQGKRKQQTTKLWDVGSGRAICAISEDGQGGSPVRSLSPDGKTLAVSLGPRLKFYDPVTGKAVQSLECPDKVAARALAWSADGKTLATAGLRSIDLWEMPLGRHVTHYTSPDGAREWRHGNTKSLCWRHDGTLAVGSCLGACVWDPTKRTVSHTIIGYPHDWVEQPCFFGPDGHLVAFLGQGLIRLCSLDDGHLRYTILNLKRDLHGALRPDGHFSGSPGLEKELVYVVQTAHGQETLAPEEFATNYGWKSEPSKLGARNGQATAIGGLNAPPPAIAPFDAAQAKQRQEALANRLHVSVKTTNSIGMSFVLIPPGEFEMGSTPREIAWALEQARRNKEQQAHLDGVSGEGLRHRVKITKPFSLGACPVTQKEFSVVMGWNPSAYSAAGRFKRVVGSIETGRHPVDMVSWEDAVEFCRQLSALPEEVAAHRTYRLPTEAEWEYACRAGIATRWWWGDDEAGLHDCAWYQENAGGMTHPVGEKKPNAWGLYDMYGNVRQWCADWFNKDYYQHSPPNDPTGPAEGTVRVLRGGAFSSMPLECCSASRYSSAPTGRSEHRGLRVVVEH